MQTQSRIPTAPSVWKKLGWLGAIWMASVLALGVIAFILRLVMNFAGMTA
jgi:hypothetical protein